MGSGAGVRTRTPQSQDADQWHERLKTLAGSDGHDAEIADEALQRCHAGRLTVHDMRLVLLGMASFPEWTPARRAVIEALSANPDLAREVLLAHTQIEVWPAPRFEQAAPGTAERSGRVTTAMIASIGPPGEQVTGPVQHAATSRAAKDRAALALLAHLAGVALPVDPPAELDGTADTDPQLLLPGMISEVFERRLNHALDAAQAPDHLLETEALRRAHGGRLRHRDIYRLLLNARGSGWEAVRTAALHRAAAQPPAPAHLLHWAAQHVTEGTPEGGEEGALVYEEEPAGLPGHHQVRARLTWGERVSTGPVRSAASRKIAKHYAASALLAELSGLPEPTVKIEEKPPRPTSITIPQQGQNPLKYLNKHHQLETITKPQATLRTHGSRTECTYSCRHRATDTLVTATGTGPNKAEARQAAALKLLHQLQAVDNAATTDAPSGHGTPRQPPLSAPAPPHQRSTPRPVLPVGNRDARTLLTAAVESMCPVVFVPPSATREAGWQVRDQGDRALPMTDLPTPLTAETHKARGWWIPLREGIAVLAQAPAQASPTVTFWQRAQHIALQLVRAQAIYPAIGEDRHGVWKAGPIPPAAEEALKNLAAAAPPGAVPSSVPVPQQLASFCDAFTDTLVRTPAAVLFADSPWTAPTPQAVDAETERAVRGWLDAVEDHVDGGATPLFLLNVEDPTDEQAAIGRLSVGLRLAASDADAYVDAGEVWSGAQRLGDEHAASVRRRVIRALRRAARTCPALAGLAGQDLPERFTMHARAIEALLEQETQLAETGVRVVWPAALRTALDTTTIVGTTPGMPSPDSTHQHHGAPKFSLTSMLDFRFQVVMRGVALSEEEMDALAEAARPLVRVRGEWVLADSVVRRRARHRLLGQLPGTQALTAALSGYVTAENTIVPCKPAGHLATIIRVLKSGEDHHPTPPPAGLQGTLRSYQQRALTWLAHTAELGFGAVLADDMGLGKTLTTLAFILHHQRNTPGPILVICPASLVATWCREAARFAPDLQVHPYHGPERTLAAITDTTVVVTTYGLLRRDHARLAEHSWGLVVADEAQHAKNHNTGAARHLRTLPAVTRLALTGTPVENNLSELWALLDWVNPSLFGTLKAFRARWATAAEKNPDGPEAAELARIISPFLLRRLKTDPGIAPELPAKIDRPRYLRLTTEQAALYEAVVRETLHQIQNASGITRNSLVLKLLTALKKITNHPAHYLREAPPRAAETSAFTTRSSKTAALVELLETIRPREEAALIFTSFVALGHMLNAHLDHLGHHPVFLHGATPLHERQRMVDDFQAGRHPVMILSLKAAGTGLTLTRAAHVVHFDRSFNAAVEDQATDRAHRIGQHQSVTVHRLITEETIEDRIDELLRHKRALQSALPTAGDQALAQLSDQELADLVRLGTPR
ncbi:SNF2-related protein [Streptomyces californicus]|uniref:SNF2-related protein n=1 Tax=Streptomyces californicus TaxID=67351 RepID=UPI00296F1496|nr:SNF2-related protein [Streptomyces californicus]MDW4912636.1 SNF2-related protein [Streptomyces californicus]